MQYFSHTCSDFNKLLCSKIVRFWILFKILVVFWCITQRDGFAAMRKPRKVIQYADSSGAQIHEDPQSRFCIFRLS